MNEEPTWNKLTKTDKCEYSQYIQMDKNQFHVYHSRGMELQIALGARKRTPIPIGELSYFHSIFTEEVPIFGPIYVVCG